MFLGMSAPFFKMKKTAVFLKVCCFRTLTLKFFVLFLMKARLSTYLQFLVIKINKPIKQSYILWNSCFFLESFIFWKVVLLFEENAITKLRLICFSVNRESYVIECPMALVFFTQDLTQSNKENILNFIFHASVFFLFIYLFIFFFLYKKMNCLKNININLNILKVDVIVCRRHQKDHLRM